MPEPTTPGAATVEAGRGAGRSVSAFLRAKTFGLPRWAFLAMLAGGVGVGLYLRSRQPPDELETGEEEDLTPLYDADTLAGTEDPGLVGAGVYSAVPGGGSVVPVTTPTLPEGFAETFESLTATLGEQSSALADVAIGNQDAQTPQPGQQPQPAPPPINITITGGGPPNSPPGRTGPKPKPNQLSARERAQYEAIKASGKPGRAEKYLEAQAGKDPFKAKPKSAKKPALVKK